MSQSTLTDWHARLAEHFSALRLSRDELNPGRPVFALEHGLSLDAELEDLGDCVRDAVRGARLPTHSSLPFVVYAAEIGYRYQGDEYWPLFEAETPHWRARGSAGRVYIRKKCEDFAATYGGAVPSGRWAAWFKNIAWPITHAILPTDLQRHLARLLYDYRHALTAELLDDYEALGDRLAQRSYDTSARFRNFAENAPLLGLVAAGLLLGDEDETPLLMQSVLHRIVVDLSHERQAGSWLRDAKKAAVRVRRRGFMAGSKASAGGGTHSDSASTRWPRLELDLSMRRGPEGWTCYMVVPSHETLASRFPEVREVLERTRYRVVGVDGVQPRGSLMYPSRPLAVTDWPESNQPVVAIEADSAQLARVLTDHCRFPPGPWLFRMTDRGFATDVRTNAVRPGHEYALLIRERVEPQPEIASVMEVRTSGVFGQLLSVPEVVDEGVIEHLKALGVGVSSDVAVWPAGLVPAFWDGEGRATWPSGEQPVLGIRSSRSVARCIVSTETEVVELDWPEDGDLIFVQLSDIAPGSYGIDVALRGTGVDDTVAQGRLLIRLLEPADSAVTAGARQGLQVRCYPPHPSITDLWTGAAAIAVDGPEGVKTQFEIALTSLGGRNTIARTTFSSSLPVSESRWRDLLRGVRGEGRLSAAYDDAEEMSVVVSSTALGSTEVRAERPFEPLRWCFGHDRAGPFARLVDHIEGEDLSVRWFDARYPARALDATLDDDRRVRVADGGLTLASYPGVEAALVLPPHVSGGLEALKKLNVRPTLQTGARSVESATRMLDLARMWTVLAAPADENAARLQNQVNDAIVARLGGMIGGQRWWEVEHELLDGPNALTSQRLLEAACRSPEELRTGRALLVVSEENDAATGERLDMFHQVMSDHRVLVDRRQATTVLQMASAPGLVSTEEPTASHAVDESLKRPLIHRLARLFVISSVTSSSQPSLALARSWPWA